MGTEINLAILHFPKFGMHLRLRTYPHTGLPAKLIQVPQINHTVRIGIVINRVPTRSVMCQPDVDLAIVRHRQGIPVPIHVPQSRE